ncbi:MAG: helix-turn-helix transcriptional regulator [Anaerolineae bacterium]|nr:helix-turn-helix domain-containing protein [Anaerolineae bacterium]MDW8100128.1 helix-turn-helix transcriptional regulator [Anaerolineae bacterium]
MENLWVIRRRKKMTVSDLAARSGVPAELIRAYERGQQPIPTEHLERFAKALYVDPWDINTLSDAPPPPIEKTTPASGAGQHVAVPARPQPQPPVQPQAPKPATSKPARSSQIEHLRGLLQHLGRKEEELVAELKKPLEKLSQREASALLARLQNEIKERGPQKPQSKRRRPYLPESVDEFEMRYLMARQQSGEKLLFRLFDGKEICGRVVGFGPYAITVGLSDGTEMTLNKLAIAYYQTIEEQT